MESVQEVQRLERVKFVKAGQRPLAACLSLDGNPPAHRCVSHHVILISYLIHETVRQVATMRRSAMKPSLEGSHHQGLRQTMRVLGPMVVVVGGLFTLVGLVSFFSAFNGGGMPRYFWCAMIGLPMVGIGLNLCRFAYLGSIQRYVASEVAPVQRDAFNFLLDGTQESVKSLARNVGQGIYEALPERKKN